MLRLIPWLIAGIATVAALRARCTVAYLKFESDAFAALWRIEREGNSDQLPSPILAHPTEAAGAKAIQRESVNADGKRAPRNDSAMDGNASPTNMEK